MEYSPGKLPAMRPLHGRGSCIVSVFGHLEKACRFG